MEGEVQWEMERKIGGEEMGWDWMSVDSRGGICAVWFKIFLLGVEGSKGELDVE